MSTCCSRSSQHHYNALYVDGHITIILAPEFIENPTYTETYIGKNNRRRISLNVDTQVTVLHYLLVCSINVLSMLHQNVALKTLTLNKTKQSEHWPKTKC